MIAVDAMRGSAADRNDAWVDELGRRTIELAGLRRVSGCVAQTSGASRKCIGRALLQGAAVGGCHGRQELDKDGLVGTIVNQQARVSCLTPVTGNQSPFTNEFIPSASWHRFFMHTTG